MTGVYIIFISFKLIFIRILIYLLAMMRNLFRVIKNTDKTLFMLFFREAKELHYTKIAIIF